MLTNRWDQGSRKEAARVFQFDSAEFEARHVHLSDELDCGRLSLDMYLDQVLLCEPRPFTKVAALNNESLELNRYRIERFQLGGYCDLFLSSCYLGVRKPDEKMYRLALQLTQHAPDECLLIDEREKNLEPAQRMGMRTIQYPDPRQLPGSASLWCHRGKS